MVDVTNLVLSIIQILLVFPILKYMIADQGGLEVGGIFALAILAFGIVFLVKACKSKNSKKKIK